MYYVHAKICIIFLLVAGCVTCPREISSYLFFPGTKPFGAGSLICHKLVIGDNNRYLLEATNMSTMICGRSRQELVVILNKGCADILYGENNSECFYLMHTCHYCCRYYLPHTEGCMHHNFTYDT